jgi:hypothetical protein
MRYTAVLFAPDGEWVTGYRGCSTVDGVIDQLVNQGSRYYFYPFHAVITDNRGFTSENQRIVDAAFPFEDLKGKTVRTMSRVISNTDALTLYDILSN